MCENQSGEKILAVEWRIKGLVQGVGFRPFIYHIARANGLNGWVENDNLGVKAFTQGTKSQIDAFRHDLIHKKPLPASILSVTERTCKPQTFSSLEIRKSQSHSNSITLVSADIAVCSDCLADMQLQPHRHGYPFINCTNCGPRFSIIRSLPYDRAATTMDIFEMCPDCRAEYLNIADRRFHAQPVSCWHCGPLYHIVGEQLATEEIPQKLADWIDAGQIVALKGVGGIHLLCDAFNAEAVDRLRFRKHRDGKPMAAMMSDEAIIKEYFFVSTEEEAALNSWRRPIVLLKNKRPFPKPVSNGLATTGIMLPYMPLHYQLFSALKTRAIVFTSGNLSDEPVSIDEQAGYATLHQLADHIASYNREIYNRADDSVLMLALGKKRLIRRSRGYAPEPVLLNLNTEGIFAAGAELANTFAIGKDNMAILSQHIGDLKNAETFDFYCESASRFSNLFKLQAELAVVDMHPDYLSTVYGRNLGLPVIAVQHHHAHIAACMAEHGLDEKVIGIALDGTGLGDDNTIWGSEFLLCDLENYERKFYLKPVMLPGGDKVIEEPWRTAVSYLKQYFGHDFLEMDLPFLKEVSPDELNWVLLALEKKINCPLSSGAGRLFDAVAALTGLCVRAGFHAEAPMRLEAMVIKDCKSKYLYDEQDGEVQLMKLFYLIIKDIKNNIPLSLIATKFHNTLIALILDVSKRLRKETNINKVVLSGGTFQNRYLLENAIQLLENQRFEVYSPAKIPANDGGIALGQLAIAAARRRKQNAFLKEDLS